MSRSLLRTTITGNGSRTLVLDDGLGTNQHRWRHVVEALAPDYRIARFDYIGTPAADLARYQAERHETLYGFADDVVDMLDDLNLRHVPRLTDSVVLLGALRDARASIPAVA